MIGRIIGFALGVVLFAVALVFASVLALVAGVAVLVLWVYLYWRARLLGRRAPQPRRPGSVVIEGEYRVERDEGGKGGDTAARVARDSSPERRG